MMAPKGAYANHPWVGHGASIDPVRPVWYCSSMATASTASKVDYVFGDIRVEPAAHRVLRNGHELELEPKAYAVLMEFLAHPGELHRAAAAQTRRRRGCAALHPDRAWLRLPPDCQRDDT